MKKTITLIITGLLMFNGLAKTTSIDKHSNQKAVTVGSPGQPYEDYFIDSVVYMLEAPGEEILSYKVEYFYGNNDRLSELIIFVPDELTLNWEYVSKFEMYYDENLYDTLELGYQYDTINLRWELYEKEERIFNLNGLLEARVHCLWDTVHNAWNLDAKREYEVIGFDEVEVISLWDSVNNVWDAVNRFDKLNDTTIKYAWWSGPNNSPFVYGKSIVQYDIDGFEVSYESYDWDDQEFVLEYKENANWYYHSKTATGLFDIASEELGVYPNPANDYVVFDLVSSEFNTLEIFNAQGQEVNSQEIEGGQDVNIEALESGVYFYSVYSSEGVQSGKFIVN